MEKASTKKRNTLKKIAIGTTVGSAPFIWSKPMLNSIMLPAHAQTSAQVLSELVGDWEGVLTESGRIFGFTILNNGLVNFSGVRIEGDSSGVVGMCTSGIEFTRITDTEVRLRAGAGDCFPSFIVATFNLSTDEIEGFLVESAFTDGDDIFVAQRV